MVLLLCDVLCDELSLQLITERIGLFELGAKLVIFPLCAVPVPGARSLGQDFFVTLSSSLQILVHEALSLESEESSQEFGMKSTSS